MGWFRGLGLSWRCARVMVGKRLGQPLKNTPGHLYTLCLGLSSHAPLTEQARQGHSQTQSTLCPSLHTY